MGLLTFQNPMMSLHGTALFALFGGYAAHFVRLRTMVFHLIFTTLVIVGFAIVSWQSGAPGMTVVYYATISVVAANGVTVVLRLYADEFQDALRRQLDSANTDALTGVLNRRGFMHVTQDLIARNPTRFVVAIADIDHYKRINDLHGHAVGDAVLARLADVVVGIVDEDVVVGRLGGDEFAIAYVGEGAVLHRIAAAIREHSSAILSDEQVTMSIGGVVCPAGSGSDATGQVDVSRTLERALAEADSALLGAKRDGRNVCNVVTAPPAEA